MSVLENAGKEAGADAAKTIAVAADNVGVRVSDAAKDIGAEVADGINITAGALNRLAVAVAEESKLWRDQVSAIVLEVSEWRKMITTGFRGTFDIGSKPTQEGK